MTRHILIWTLFIVGLNPAAFAQDPSTAQTAPDGDAGPAPTEEDVPTPDESAPAAAEKEPANTEESVQEETETEADATEETNAEDETTPALPEGAQENAQEMPGLSKAQHRWLEPKRTQLEQVPRAQTDFTAYTLEWGEIKVGLASITIGALPRTQIGTVPALDIVGVTNGHVKVNILRVGGFDLGVGGNLYRLQIGDFVGTRTGGSAYTSMQLLDPWSLHIGTTYANFHADGVPDASRLPSLLTGGADADTFLASQEGNEDAWLFDGRNVRMHIATDYRFNRRDSLLFQIGATVWSKIETGFEAPPILGLDEVFENATDTSNPIQKSLVTSLSWQWTWRKVDLRVGAGLSNVPGAWILQSTDLSYRFGGKTRSSERRMNRTWKRNKSDTK